MTPGTTQIATIPSIDDAPAKHRRPRHVAIIMDGNGRWATQRELNRTRGHEQGARIIPDLVQHAVDLELEALTLYSFSMENWKRPVEEVAFLMELCVEYLAAQLKLMMKNNVRFHHVGRREGLPEPVLKAIDNTIEATKGNTGMRLALAMNYGSRYEITAAVKAIAEKVAAGEVRAADVSPELIEGHLYTAGLPDPDLLIRTAGEMRISNFLLWQISYAELWVTDTLWPDFTLHSLHQALHDYANRDRRFGGVVGK